jgi:hypothetical protein
LKRQHRLAAIKAQHSVEEQCYSEAERRVMRSANATASILSAKLTQSALLKLLIDQPIHPASNPVEIQPLG